MNPYGNDISTIFVARFLPSGIIDWAMFYNNVNSTASGSGQYGSGIASDSYGNFFITGNTNSYSISVSGYNVYTSSGYSIQTSSGTIKRLYDSYGNAFVIKFTTDHSAYRSVSISPLNVGSTYYIRSAVQNVTGLTYSPSTYLYKHIIYGLCQITNIYNITTNNASINVNVSSLGGDSSVVVGVVWSYSRTLPTIDSQGGYIDGSISSVSSITSTGDIPIANIGGVRSLNPHTNYYVRPFITTSRGTNYGDVQIFQTKIAYPTAYITTINGLTNVQVSVNVTLQSVGGQNSFFGVFYSSTNPNPMVGDLYAESSRNPRGDPNELNVILTNNIGGTFILTGLTPNTLYYIRGYARNDAGYAYDGFIQTFTTLPNLPTLSTTTLVSINYR